MAGITVTGGLEWWEKGGAKWWLSFYFCGFYCFHFAFEFPASATYK